MKKKILSLLIAITMIFSFSVTGFAKGKNPLQFNNDGKFTIVHLTDSHIKYPMDNYIRQYITEMLNTVKPDLVVLGGDVSTENQNTNDVSINPLESSIEEICSLLVDNSTYFTLTLGNHDRQTGKSGEELFSLYSKFGGKYFLGYDAAPEINGYGTHDLPIMSSDGSKVAFNLYMFDSGDSVYDDNGNYLGYDSVHADQIEWYKSRANQLKAENGGNAVPSMAFQHIIVQEIDDLLFYNVKRSVGKIGEDFENKHYLFTPIPKIHNIKNGFIMEKPCPGYYNFGQLEAMRQTGGMLAIFSGHDHSNTFTVNIDGIDVVNTGGCKYQAPLRLFTSGVRVITLDEKNLNTYKSEMFTIIDASKAEDSQIFASGGIKKYEIIITRMWEKLFTFAMTIVQLFNR